MSGKLRARPISPPFHVVLVEPEIPPNTGNIARLCAATQSTLHLVGRLGFRIDNHAVRRAGLDYWHLVDVKTHVDFPHFLHAFAPRGASAPLAATTPKASEQGFGGALHLFSAGSERSYLSVPFAKGDALVFGKESTGLAPELLEAHKDRVVAIPTLGAVRSLNLSNAVSIVMYEALRKVGALDETFIG